ncbi:MAG: response regulator [Alphaproteobacteria bacterium]|nr:response regulator [Alphaproteobacteria bacterium]
MSGRPVGDRTTVLLVDDEPDALEECAAIVEDSGYPWVAARSGEEALAILETTPSIGIVMTDVRMPGMDGIALISAIHERYQTDRNIRTVVITGHASLDLAVQAMRYDAVDFLSKPASRAEFVDALMRADQARAGAPPQRPQRDRIAELSGEVERIRKALAELTTSPAPASTPAAGGAAVSAGPVDAAFVRGIIRGRQARSRFFSADLFADPAWDILLDLTESRLEGKEISISSLCLASGVPPSTALRWIKSMTDEGMLIRRADPADGRRFIVEMSEPTAMAMTKCLEAIREKLAG